MYDATRPGFSREYQGRVTLARFRVPLYTALTLASVQDVDAHFFSGVTYSSSPSKCGKIRCEESIIGTEVISREYYVSWGVGFMGSARL